MIFRCPVCGSTQSFIASFTNDGDYAEYSEPQCVDCDMRRSSLIRDDLEVL